MCAQPWRAAPLQSKTGLGSRGVLRGGDALRMPHRIGTTGESFQNISDAALREITQRAGDALRSTPQRIARQDVLVEQSSHRGLVRRRSEPLLGDRTHAATLEGIEYAAANV